MLKTRAPKASRFKTKPAQGLPDRETLLKYIREAGETDKAEIAATTVGTVRTVTKQAGATTIEGLTRLGTFREDD